MALSTPTVPASPMADAHLRGWRARLKTTRRLALVLAGLAAMLSGGVLLLGWMADIQGVRRLPGQPGMAVTAAAGGLACAILLMRRILSSAAARRRPSPLPAAVLLAAALAGLVFLAVDPARGLDQVLFGFIAVQPGAYMSPATAVCLALSALCLMLPLNDRRFCTDLFGPLVATGLAITVFAMTGYLFDSAALRDVFVFTAMSPQTALTFLLIFLAFAASQPTHGWMQILLGPRPGSATLRRTLPFVVVGPFFLCWLALLAVDHGIFNANFRLSLIASVGMMGLITLLFWSAQRENAGAHELLHSNKRLRRALAERNIFFKEVHHRVKNNLQLLDAMLALEADKLDESSGIARERLEAIRQRVHALALVHQQLIETHDLATLDLKPFLEDLCAHLAQGAGLDMRRILVRTSIPSLHIGFDRAVPIGLMVTELFSNAIKHAFPNGREGTISVDAEAIENRTLALSIHDDGIGLSIAAAAKAQMGNLILTSLVAQLKAQMEVEDRDGLHVTIHIPLSST